MSVWTAALAIALQLAAPLAITDAHRTLLRQSDVRALAPDSFVARLELTADRDRVTHAIEVWRAGDDRLLVRFLDEGQRGRYLLRRGRDLWLLTPLAKAPVKVPASYRIYGGVTIDEILGLRLTSAYRIAGVSESPGPPPVTTFDLRATAKDVTFPRILYDVDPQTARPVRASYALASGKVATVARFLEWHTSPVLHPQRLTLRDEVRQGAMTTVVITGLEARPIPAGVFELSGHAAREALGAAPR